MNRYIILFLFAFLTAQVTSKSPRAIVDEAKTQLDELKSLVQGTIIVAHDDLSSLNTDFLNNGENVVTEGAVSIQEQHESSIDRVTSIKELAESANVDVTPCTVVREQLLNRLPEEFNGQLRRCIVEINNEEDGLVTDARYIVDIAFSTVQNLEFQIDRCGTSDTCAQPLLTQILLNQIRLPQNIKTEVDAFSSFLTSLRVSVKECSDSSISEYVANADALVEDIEKCVNQVLG